MIPSTICKINPELPHPQSCTIPNPIQLHSGLAETLFSATEAYSAKDHNERLERAYTADLSEYQPRKFKPNPREHGFTGLSGYKPVAR
jgi:hypothetical protein